MVTPSFTFKEWQIALETEPIDWEKVNFLSRKYWAELAIKNGTFIRDCFEPRLPILFSKWFGEYITCQSSYSWKRIPHNDEMICFDLDSESDNFKFFVEQCLYPEYFTIEDWNQKRENWLLSHSNQQSQKKSLYFIVGLQFDPTFVQLCTENQIILVGYKDYYSFEIVNPNLVSVANEPI